MTNFTTAEILVYFFSGIILAVMMMNLLIAVISLTFEQFEEKRMLVDLEEMETILYDHSIFLNFIQNLIFFQREDLLKSQSRESYAFVAIRVVEDDEDEAKKLLDGLEGKMEVLDRKMDALLTANTEGLEASKKILKMLEKR